MKQKKTRGFDPIVLSKEAYTVLESFKETGQCVTPVQACKSLSSKEVYVGLVELNKLNFIILSTPYKLTKKGQRFLKN